ncbi:hypothetical protein [Thermophilibacter provencensis]|uniref:Uncharacterized protein n=1 Tax=Thermophilibacter provencensis TaxID=1852386 RepID=A0ABT7V2C1_9ACTN|nr:hypothetical protein [Thermophilibacter provencensis]MDM8270751.1 hypothetical protein [Thermophilibacter provencensis]
MGVASFTVRPAVPMGHVTGVPFVVALGVAESLDARLGWPYEVLRAPGEPLAHVRARAGYDDEGVFVACDVVSQGEKDLDAAALEAAARARVDAWAADVAAGRAAAGPLAPVLGTYFDALLGMGETCEVVRAGRVIARGELAGVDVWGRATVRLENGTQELEIAPEQAELRPVSA